MTKQTEAIKLVLKHAEPSFLSAGWTLVRSEGIKALREALAEQPAQQEPESFEQWNAKQHGDPEEIGFLQALRIAYIAGQDSTPPQPAQRKPLTDEEFRSEFERWHKANFVQPLDIYNNSYRNMHVRNRWQGWVAAHGIKENT